MPPNREELATDLGTALGQIVASYEAPRIFLVAGKNSYNASGAQIIVEGTAQEHLVGHFSHFSPNPTLDEVKAGVAHLRASKPNLVLAIGGGSALDLAKMISVIAANPGNARAYLTGEQPVQNKGVPVIAVPTTAGSGAEATHFCAVYVDGIKYSMTHRFLRPTHVVLDSTLTQSLSPYLTAATGMDALSQAIESYWSVRSTEESRNLSAQAIKLCYGALANATQNPSDDVARESMLTGAHLAGRAIDIARTTAPHALSYRLTTQFGITHGHAVALTLGAIFEANGRGVVTDPRGVDYVQRTLAEICDLLGCQTVTEARKILEDLMKQCHLATRLRAFGVTRSDLSELVTAVNPDRLGNNPCKLPPDLLGAILEKLL